VQPCICASCPWKSGFGRKYRAEELWCFPYDCDRGGIPGRMHFALLLGLTTPRFSAEMPGCKIIPISMWSLHGPNTYAIRDAISPLVKREANPNCRYGQILSGFRWHFLASGLLACASSSQFSACGNRTNLWRRIHRCRNRRNALTEGAPRFL
jgi:hypothetical protein